MIVCIRGIERVQGCMWCDSGGLGGSGEAWWIQGNYGLQAAFGEEVRGAFNESTETWGIKTGLWDSMLLCGVQRGHRKYRGAIMPKRLLRILGDQGRSRGTLEGQEGPSVSQSATQWCKKHQPKYHKQLFSEPCWFHSGSSGFQ